MAESTVSRLLRLALSALGLRDLAEASRLRSMAHSTTHVGAGPEGVHVGVLFDTAPETAQVLPNHIGRLSRAEREVLAAIVRGCSHQQVAALRGTSKRTVANQVASIFGKLGVRSRRELVARVVAGAPESPPEVQQR